MSVLSIGAPDPIFSHGSSTKTTSVLLNLFPQLVFSHQLVTYFNVTYAIISFMGKKKIPSVIVHFLSATILLFSSAAKFFRRLVSICLHFFFFHSASVRLYSCPSPTYTHTLIKIVLIWWPPLSQFQLFPESLPFLLTRSIWQR